MTRIKTMEGFQVLGITVVISLLLSVCVLGGVDNETCLNCHENYDNSLLGTPHQLGSTFEVSCERCHKDASQHADDPSADNIASPATLTEKEAFDICGECHKPHSELDDFGFDVHLSQTSNCGNCHKIHNSHRGLLKDDHAKFCSGCHTDVAQRFNLYSSHPVNSHAMNCLSCHSFTKKHDYTGLYDSQRLCQDCHPEQSGPFAFEHEATNAYMVDGNGCSDCHDPHGSVNDRLLKQDLANQCRQCHYLPSHEIAHGGMFTQTPCITCHTQTHGSYSSDLFLDPDMPAKLGNYDCYQSGCHTLMKE